MALTTIRRKNSRGLFSIFEVEYFALAFLLEENECQQHHLARSAVITALS
ncbi:MAG: hypothetical protein QOH63_3930 [Acidobacteriota bacterium]|jgi:hypothetical protein|nr:hypothetical protein [Acidobacteriota bacterium]